MSTMKDVTLEINGKNIRAKDGMSILQAAQAADIEIPTFCYHEKLEPYGACRLCIVEITEGKRTRLVTSCVYLVKEGLMVKTNTERVNKIRKMILELLLPLAPTGPLKTLAHQYGVKESRFPAEPTFCILCGLCVRYCAEIKKENAICFMGRGIDRHIVFVSEISAGVCSFCRECHDLCPSGKITKLSEEVASLSPLESEI